MWRFMTIAAVILTATASALGQVQQPPPAPGTGPLPPSRPIPVIQKTPHEVEGMVKRVDPVSGTVQVSPGSLGLGGRTLEITGDTAIQVEGRQGGLVDLREGSRVIASYETTRDGKSVATRIQIVPAAK